MKPRSSDPILPREHGFWVMLVASLLGAALEHPDVRVWGGALLVGACVSVLAGGFARQVRRSAGLQVLAAAVLPWIAAPVELLAGGEPAPVVVKAASWMVIFGAGALVVRAVFERAARRSRSAWRLECGAVLASAVAGGAFWLSGSARSALALLLASVTYAVVSALRPSVKQLRPVGLTFAGLSGVALALLVF